MCEQCTAYVEEWVGFVRSELAIGIINPVRATVDQLIAAYTAGGDDIGWDAYTERFDVFLSQLDRP